MQDVAETQEKDGLKEECIEFYDKVSHGGIVPVVHVNASMQISSNVISFWLLYLLCVTNDGQIWFEVLGAQQKECIGNKSADLCVLSCTGSRAI